MKPNRFAERELWEVVLKTGHPKQSQFRGVIDTEVTTEEPHAPYLVAAGLGGRYNVPVL
jgi:hypothetical protein